MIDSNAPEHISWYGNNPKDARSFCRDIASQVEKGYGFVPFIGAGFSAPSGSPLINDLQEYLKKCICAALGLGWQKDAVVQPWNPRTDQWPPLVDHQLIRDDEGKVLNIPKGTWDRLLYHVIRTLDAKAAGALQTPAPASNRDARLFKHSNVEKLVDEISKLKAGKEWSESEAWLRLFKEAYGAMQEWRSALLFLSRLRLSDRNLICDWDQKYSSIGLPRQDPPRQEAIDGFFREALQGRFPSLNHRMLACLAGVMRIDLVLTVNFDDLVERAFTTARNPLEVLEVPLSGRLPEYSVLSQMRALVKLHGGRMALRADYSTDSPPDEEDKRRFLSYLLTPKERSQQAKDIAADVSRRRLSSGPGGYSPQNHLLILGFSANDWRIREFISYAILHLDDSFVVYWICHTENDVKNVEEFSEQLRRISELDVRERIKVIRHTNPGLLLFQTYQTLRKSLPPLGAIFPAISRQTFPPLSVDRNRSTLGGWNSALLREIERSQPDPKSEMPLDAQLIVVSGKPDLGITAHCASVYQELETKPFQCLWIDMNDVSSTDNLYEVLLESFYYRLGIEDWIPATKYSDINDPRSYPQVDELCRLAESVDKQWVVFVNAREIPGSNTERQSESNAEPRNLLGWLKNDAPEPSLNETYEDLSNNVDSFLAFLSKLSSASERISVVLICYHDLNFAASSLGNIRSVQGRLEGTGFDVQRKVGEAIDLLKQDKGMERFVHALCLMQRPRLWATLWSDAVGRPSDAKALEWIESLEESGILRSKPGGLIWFHAECRKRFRIYFQELKDWENSAKIHTELAQWYERILDASDTPSAAMESAYHFCRAANDYLLGGTKKHREIATNIAAATAILRTNALLIQTHGYSRGSCRRLESLAQDAEIIFSGLANVGADARKEAEDAICELWLMCAEIMRAIAREVGEDAKAYYRHYLVGWLLINRRSRKIRNWSAAKGLAGRMTKEKGGYQDFRTEFEKAFGIDTSRQGTEPNGEWLRWRRWQGMLAIEARSQRFFETMFAPIVGKINEEGVNDSRVKFGHLPSSEAQRSRIEVCRILEQSVEMALIENSVCRRLNRKEEFLIEKIEARIDRGIRLVRKVRDQDLSSDSHDTVLANWCEVRMLMHRSVLAADRQDFTAAMGVLGEAEARLRVADQRRARGELAMIDLHRAECKIRSAEMLPCSPTNPTSFVSLIQKKFRDDPQMSWEKASRELRRECGGKVQLEAKFRELRSLADDAIRFLNRADSPLRERRRNVWWTTWYFERRLRAISIAVWASCLEKESPIPHFGLEAVMRANQTEAERLLDNACRMIRVDAYRLSTILASFHSCLEAFDTRLNLEYGDKAGVALPLRQKQLREMLKTRNDALREVIRRRHLNRTPDSNAWMDGNFEAYIELQQMIVNKYVERSKTPGAN